MTLAFSAELSSVSIFSCFKRHERKLETFFVKMIETNYTDMVLYNVIVKSSFFLRRKFVIILYRAELETFCTIFLSPRFFCWNAKCNQSDQAQLVLLIAL